MVWRSGDDLQKDPSAIAGHIVAEELVESELALRQVSDRLEDVKDSRFPESTLSDSV
jgi:hypothetical protein